jgi:hypothetical protein
MLRSLVVLVVAVVAAVAVTTSAFAGKPTREPLFIEDIALPDTCPFPVLIEVTANKEYVTFFPDGRIHVTGKLFVRITNLDTGESLDVNISGPGLIWPDSERIHGRSLFLAFPEDVGGPGIVLTTGRVDVIRGEDGPSTSSW